MKITIDSMTSHPLYEQAEAWYNAAPKAEIVRFCAERGLNLDDGEQLQEDWNSQAIACYLTYLSDLEDAAADQGFGLV